MIRFLNILPSSSSQTVHAKLMRGDGGPISPEIERIDHPNVTATITEVRPGEEYDLVVVASPPWPTEPFRLTPRIRTGVPELPHQSITIYGAVVPSVQVSPSRVLFPIGQGTPQVREVRVTWRDSNDWRILDLEFADKDVQFEIVDEGEANQRIRLTVPAGHVPAQPQLNLRVHTDDPENPVVTVPVQFVGSRPGSQPQAAPGVGARPRVVPVPSGTPK